MWRWAAVFFVGLAAAADPLVACVSSAEPGTEIKIENGGALASANFSGPTRIYAHGILGDAVEYVALQAGSKNAKDLRCRQIGVNAGDGHVFEDTAPRAFDLTGDGTAELIVVRTSIEQGAQLAVYADAGDGFSLDLIATTPYIGRTHRWLAPIGIADIDGDGRIEIPVVDRPHLARVLQIWEWRDGGLHLEAQMEGVTNHRIGDDWISGGIRDCGQGAQMVVLSPDWSDIRAVTWDGETFRMGRIGPNTGRASVEAAVACN